MPTVESFAASYVLEPPSEEIMLEAFALAELNGPEE